MPVRPRPASSRTASAAAPAADLIAALDRLVAAFARATHVDDPVRLLSRYPDPADREVAAFLAAGLAFGRVRSVINSVESVLAVMGPAPAAFVRRFSIARDGRRLRPLVHRWSRGEDLIALVLVLQRMLCDAGSIEQFFARGLDPDAPDVEAALESFAVRACAIDVSAAYGPAAGRRGVTYFFPRPGAGSACKRLNLFLRWMVRRDAVDPGGWSAIRPSQLIVPLDVHVIRVGRCLRLTRYQSPGWRMATDITASLRRLDPGDPVKYDFALCHLGMMGECGFSRAQRDAICPLRGFCRPGRRTPRAWPPPSDPR
jgi:uncharacterized protein (TIGR02757 family)